MMQFWRRKLKETLSLLGKERIEEVSDYLECVIARLIQLSTRVSGAKSKCLPADPTFRPGS
jgi:hypothetical protein